MVSPEYLFVKQTALCLLDLSQEYLGEFPNVSQAIQDFRQNPRELVLRVREFEQARIQMVTAKRQITQGNADYHSQDYSNLIQLAGALEYRSLLPLNSLREVSIPTMQQINRLVVAGAQGNPEGWVFPNTETDSRVLASGLLLEGYGLLLENITQRPNLGSKFVLGMEEVLYHNFPDSRLLKDVLPWMVEEKASFGIRMRHGLEIIAPL